MFRPGNIVLSQLPQADGELKNRPLFLLTQMPGMGDWLVCGISSQLYLALHDFDELIGESDPEFSATGLKSAGLIRTGFVGVLPETRFQGILGGLREARAKSVLGRLGHYLVRQAG